MGKSMGAAIWFLAVPVLLQQLLAACVGLVDKVLAGGLPGDIARPAMDAIGVGAYVGWFISIAMAGIGIGGQALIARAMGSGDRDLAHRTLAQCMVLALGWGVVVSIGIWIAAAPLAVVTGLSREASELLVTYMHVLAWGMPFCSVLTVGCMALHGSGDTLRPALVTAAVNLVNVPVSWILSGADIRLGGARLENPFELDLLVPGIAAGTAIAYGVGAVLIIAVLMRGVKDLRLRASDLPIERVLMGRVARIGIPQFLEGLSMWTANLFVLFFVGQIALKMGRDGVPIEGLQGAHAIATQWEAFSFLPGFAIGTAAGTLAGQYLGAGDLRRARRSILACVGIAVLVMGSMGAVMMIAGHALTSIISEEPVHLALTPKLLFIAGAIQTAFAVLMVIRQGLRGAGDTTWTFIITTVSGYGIRLPAVWYIGVHLEMGLVGVWYALCGELCVRALLFLGRFLHGGWMHKEL